MKYIFKPIWFLILCCYTLIEIIYLVLINISSVLYHLNTDDLTDWVDWTKEELCMEGVKRGYDKNPWETIIRRFNNTNYKNYK